MSFNPKAAFILLVLMLGLIPTAARAETDAAVLEQAMSGTLDLWREGHFEQLYEQLSHRGKMSRERFTRKMRESVIHPACCFQKMQGFRVLSEKRTEATVYVTIGLEGGPGSAESCTREFKLSHEGGEWKMQLNDITALANGAAKKSRHTRKKH
ncbi:hypothetical protein [Geobacter sp. SVR]|uniref:hypothetical protein n=1 Tax=Geobacter sp. SVR TaxID=2495594 RepID=UPI00143EFF1B|nr:hypothetical protein [Geobacter sp. SVR]BCS54610.1 hypothetical protein GSVR_29180 [Geobacter sp. SVR]GCF86883.1 hypothetical protein GSbR_34830 [Geobacter sp. SVR]